MCSSQGRITGKIRQNTLHIIFDVCYAGLSKVLNLRFLSEYLVGGNFCILQIGQGNRETVRHSLIF